VTVQPVLRGQEDPLVHLSCVRRRPAAGPRHRQPRPPHPLRHARGHALRAGPRGRGAGRARRHPRGDVRPGGGRRRRAAGRRGPRREPHARPPPTTP